MNLEETNKSEPTYEEFSKFMESIGLSDEAIEEINDGTEESNKPINKPLKYEEY